MNQVHFFTGRRLQRVCAAAAVVFLCITNGPSASGSNPRGTPTPAPKALPVHKQPAGEIAPEKLDLLQAEAIALKFAPQISEAYYRAEASRETVRDAQSGLYPQITGILTAAGTGPGIENAFGGDHSTAETTRIGASGGLNNPSVYNRESNGIALTQLVTDFGRTPELISAARYESLSEGQRAVLARAQVLLLVDEAYFKALGAQALLSVAGETLADRQLTVDRVSELTKSKLKSELDLRFAKVDLENAKLLVLQAQNEVDESFAGLSAALGYREERHFALADEPQFAFPAADISLLIERALQYRPEIIALRAESQGAKKFSEAERAARYPTVSIMGTVGRTPIGDSAVRGNYEAAGLNVEVPIFTGGMLSARYQKALDEANAAEKAVEGAEEEIVRDVRDTWLDTLTAQKKIQASRELLTNANEELDLAQSRYKMGVTSIIELSQAQLSQTQAQIGYASALYEYQIDRVKLDFQTSASKFRAPGAAKSAPVTAIPGVAAKHDAELPLLNNP